MNFIRQSILIRLIALFVVSIITISSSSAFNLFSKALPEDLVKEVQRIENIVQAEFDKNVTTGSLDFSQFKKLREQMDRIIAKDDSISGAYLLRAKINDTLGDYQKSVADLDKVIKKEPGNFEAYLYRGKARYVQQRLQEAIVDFRKVQDLNPDYEYAYGYLCTTESMLKNYSRAIAACKKEIQIHPNTYSGPMYIAFSLMEQKGKSAKSEILEYMDMAIKNLKTYKGRSQELQMMERYAEGIRNGEIKL